jgi:hypothetical protein
MTDTRGDAVEDALVSLHLLADAFKRKKASEEADCGLELQRDSLALANDKARESECAADCAAANLRTFEARLATFNAEAAKAKTEISAQLIADYPLLANDFQLSFDASRLIRNVECAKKEHEAAVITQDADYDDAERIERAYDMAVASAPLKRFKPAACDLSAVLDLIKRLSRA